MGWKSKSERAKKLHRPSLSNWERDGLFQTFPGFVTSILTDPSKSYQASLPFGKTKHASWHNKVFPKTLPQIPALLDAKHVSACEFQQQYEANGIPAVILNVPQGYSMPSPVARGYEWKALTRWNLDALEADVKLKDRRLKCGEDDNGKSIRMKLKHFIRYLRNNRDDSPLYIFDSTFDEDLEAQRLLNDYQVPTYFDEDLFRLVGEKRRPPYRWFLVGPERSGTCVHIDPLGTSAWNTLIYGLKRWVLFPPYIPKHIVKGTKQIRKHEDDEAIHYFMTILPRIKNCALESEGSGGFTNFECYEFTQYAGETVFIPNGWWHAVLNLTHTVGVTQNYCSQRNFDAVWIKTRKGRKRMAYKWLCQLETHFPHLAIRAKDLDKKDNFVMRYDPKEAKRRELKREGRKRKEKQAKEYKREEKKGNKRLNELDTTAELIKRRKSSHSLTDVAHYNYDSKRRRVKRRRMVSP